MKKVVIKRINGDIIFSYISKNNSMCKTILKYIEVCKKRGKIADFSYANFREVDFSHADFRWINFRVVNFSRADFSNADFSWVNFSHTDFSNADFRNANFIGANFTNADFSYTEFRWVDFRYANFSNADFRGVNFTNADFNHADFSYANFSNANFIGANFTNADFSNTDFREVDFRGANFSYTDFRWIDFSNADFSWVNFTNTDFREVDLRDTNFSNTINFLINCPEEGSFIAYKKASTDVGIPVIVVIRVEEDSLRSSATSKKCRASKVTPLRFEDLKGNILPEDTIVFSDYDNSFIYHIGKTIEVENFDLNRWNECSTGIHFFMNKLDAIHY